MASSRTDLWTRKTFETSHPRFGTIDVGGSHQQNQSRGPADRDSIFPDHPGGLLPSFGRL